MASERERGPMPEHVIERLSDLLAAAIIADVRAQLRREQEAGAREEPTGRAAL